MARRTGIWVKMLSAEDSHRRQVREVHRRGPEAAVSARGEPDQVQLPPDIVGKWRGSKYSFITRYRSGFPDNRGEEFDAPFTRLDHAYEHPADVRFNVMWRRHTGQWWRLYSAVSLDEALRLIETDLNLQPLV